MRKLITFLALGGIIAFAFYMISGGDVRQDPAEFVIEDFHGQPSVVFFAGTYCPHCQNAVPGYESEVWDAYKNDVNVWLQVVDGAEGATFDTVMAQGYNATLSYTGLSGEECGYVPSWVILDTEGSPVTSSCGSSQGVDVIVETLEGML
jgi:hypothetical protein